MSISPKTVQWWIGVSDNSQIALRTHCLPDMPPLSNAPSIFYKQNKTKIFEFKPVRHEDDVGKRKNDFFRENQVLYEKQQFFNTSANHCKSKFRKSEYFNRSNSNRFKKSFFFQYQNLFSWKLRKIVKIAFITWLYN